MVLRANWYEPGINRIRPPNTACDTDCPGFDQGNRCERATSRHRVLMADTDAEATGRAVRWIVTGIKAAIKAGISCGFLSPGRGDHRACAAPAVDDKDEKARILMESLARCTTPGSKNPSVKWRGCGCAGVKLWSREALCVERKGPGDEGRGAVCEGPLRGRIEGISRREAARRFGIDPGTVAEICRSRCRRAAGGAGRRRVRSWIRWWGSSTPSWRRIRPGRRSSDTRRSELSSGCATSTRKIFFFFFFFYVNAGEKMHRQAGVKLHQG